MAFNKTNIEEEILRFQYVCYPLQNRRRSCCFVTSWLLLALRSSHLHAICFLGWVFFLNHHKWAWDFGVSSAARHHSLAEIQLKQFSLTLKLPDHAAAVASWRCANRDTQIQHTDKEVVYGEPQTEPHYISNPSYSHPLTWSIFGFFLKKKNSKTNKKTGIYIICKCVILQVAWSQGNLKAPCVTRGRWVL